jgi:hypothetical protein
MRALACFLALFSASALAQPDFIETRYDQDVPTLQEVIGHAPGQEITAPDEALGYMRALQRSQPDRMRIFEYATSWEGRPLVYAVIGRPDRIRELDSIQQGLERLADGRSVTGRDRTRMIERLPAVTWLSYGVHGNEITSTDAGLAVAYHLLAAEGDADVEAIFENSLVIIDPMQNPDGRARFMSTFTAARGLEPQGADAAAERDEPWPSGRYNHALFDLNRDWFTLSQPETRGKVKAIDAWNPVVVVDAHEMGSGSTYFFPPAARPFNPQLTENTREGQEIIGRANAEVFDERGVSYFTRETYDNFYPGYGDMWPALRGAVAMTYEQASPRGLRFDREDGSVLTYREGVRNHFLTTLTTAVTVARNKERFLSAYVEDRTTAIEEMSAAEDRYLVIDLAERPGQARALASRLSAQGIDVAEIREGQSVCGTDYAEGAIVIDKAQPEGRLIDTLLDENTPLAEDFIEDQEARRTDGLRHELYDVTAWSLPLMSGLESQSCGDVGNVRLRDFSADEGDAPNLPEAAFGYAVPWDDSAQAQLVIAALREGLEAQVTEEGFSQDDRTFPRGTVVFTQSANEDHLAERLAVLAGETGGRVLPMASSWVDEGPNLGSSSFRALDLPRVAMLWGEGTSPTSAGSTRYVIERRLGLPVTPIRVLSLSYADLSGFDVIVMPETGSTAARVLGASGQRAIQEFAEEGGVVVGFGSALRLISGEKGLLPLQRERRVRQDGERRPAQPSGSVVEGSELWSEEDYQNAVGDTGSMPDRVPGVLLTAEPDPNHILSAGYDDATVLFRGNTIYAPLPASEGTNVFRYADADSVLASGYLWDEVRTQIARKPFLVAKDVGEGMAVGFAQDPTTRGYLNGLDLMLANSLVLAPAFAD